MSRDEKSDIFDATDVRSLVEALAAGTRRVERLRLGRQTVWIKRYSRHNKPVWTRLHAGFAAFCRMPVLKPSPVLNAKGMVSRELARMQAFTDQGFLTARLICRTEDAIVLADAGQTVDALLKEAKASSDETHDALLVLCARELGRVHASGLCHGRPHPRDFVLRDGQIVFLDFEEAPDEVMPIAQAQARDLWLLFLQVASRARLGKATLDQAYAAWAAHAPWQAAVEVRIMMAQLAFLVPAARALYRLRRSRDVGRFVAVAEYFKALAAAPLTEAQSLSYQFNPAHDSV